jgi:hypothetical protein
MQIYNPNLINVAETPDYRNVATQPVVVTAESTPLADEAPSLIRKRLLTVWNTSLNQSAYISLNEEATEDNYIVEITPKTAYTVKHLGKASAFTTEGSVTLKVSLHTP